MTKTTNSPDRHSDSQAGDGVPLNSNLIHPHSVARNTALLLSFHVFTKLLAFVSFILLANYLGTEAFGVYNYAFALTALFIPLCDLGMDMYLMREVPKLREDQIPVQLGAALSWKGFMTFLVFLLISLTGSILDSFGTGRFYIMVIAGLITLLRAFWTTFGSLLRAMNKVGYEVVLLSGARLSEFITIVISVNAGIDLLTMLSILAILNLLAVALTYAIVHVKITKPVPIRDFENLLSMIKEGFPFALTSIFSTIYFNFDTVLVSKFIGDEAAGIYRAAYNLVFPLMNITISINGALFPFVSQNYRRDKQKVEGVVRKALTYLVFLGLPIAFGTLILSKDLVHLFFEPEFSSASISLSILIWFIPIAFLTQAFSAVLGAIGDQKFVLKIITVNVLFNVIANLFFIPIYAQVGASVIIVATELIGFIFLFHRISSKIEHPIEYQRIGKGLFALGAMIIFLIYRPFENIPMTIGVAALIYFFIIFVIKALTIQELRLITNFKQETHADR
ncbi:MAG: flippase [bacterium]